MKFLAALTIVVLGVSGCSTMKIGSTDGVKSMLQANYESQVMRRTVSEVVPPDKQALDAAYNKVCVENNSFIGQLIFDLMAKSSFSLSAQEFAASPGAQLVTAYLQSATASVTDAKTGRRASPPSTASVAEPVRVGSPLVASTVENSVAPSATPQRTASVASILNAIPSTGTAELALAMAVFANAITNNIVNQNNVKVEQARGRIVELLESSKWGGCGLE